MATEIHGAGRAGPRLAAPAVLAALLLAGCLGGPPPVLTDYTLDYSPPEPHAAVPLPVQLNVELRAANDLLTKTDMLYQQKPYSLNAYVYDRWAAPPVDLVQAHLLRDLRASGLFEGVFAYRGNLRARFLLTGTLEEFHEVDGAESGHGRLRLTMSLLDLGEHGTEQVLLFQRAYAAEGPEKAQEAGGLAASMSEAMQSVSGNLIADVHSALVKRAAGDS